MINKERNPRWSDAYPTVIPDFSHFKNEESPYGKPNSETLELFCGLAKGSTILDVGGGDGRYALPLAQMGHSVVVLDVDMPHLIQVKKKNSMIFNNLGRMMPIQADALTNFPVAEKKYSAVLNAGFGYLLPPDDLDGMFGDMVQALKPNGLFVLEFATNRDRRDLEGNSLLGHSEYNYTGEESLRIIGDLSKKHGIYIDAILEKTIHMETPYYLHNDLLIVEGYMK